jgi:hypothetical protein
MLAETRKHKQNKNPRLQEANISEKREDIWENLHEDLQTGEHKANNWISSVTL